MNYLEWYKIVMCCGQGKKSAKANGVNRVGRSEAPYALEVNTMASKTIDALRDCFILYSRT